jgi:hypothetical protein
LSINAVGSCEQLPSKGFSQFSQESQFISQIHHRVAALDLAVALGSKVIPAWQSPDLEVLRERGIAHENAYLEHLKAQGATIVDLRDVANEERAAAGTIAAMKKGVDIIAQATLSGGRWSGRADVLRRVERASAFGNWSYEVQTASLPAKRKWQRFFNSHCTPSSWR